MGHRQPDERVRRQASPSTTPTRRLRRPAGLMETMTPTAEQAIAAAAARYRNWGRWGPDDRLGTVNFIDEAKRRQAAGLVRRGVSISLSQSFDTDGPQKGWRRRTNPVHTMTRHRHRRRRGQPGLPARDRRRRRRHRHAPAVLDAMGRARAHLRPRHGLERPPGGRRRHLRRRPGHRDRAPRLVDRRPRRAAGRRPGSSARTGSCPTASPSPRAPAGHHRRPGLHLAGRSRRHRPGAHRTADPGPSRGLARLRRRRLPRPVVLDRGLAARHRDRRDRHRHLGVRGATQRVPRTPSNRCTRSPSRNIGLLIGEMWDLDALAAGLRSRRRLRVPARRRARSRSPAPSAPRSTRWR